MAFLQGDNKFRPRTKKEKQKLQDRRKRELKAKKEREQHQRNTPAFNPTYNYPRRNQNINISSKGVQPLPKDNANSKPVYSDEMLEREKAAQLEAERRKKCVAPAYNKGAYQPIFTKEQAKYIGRS